MVQWGARGLGDLAEGDPLDGEHEQPVDGGDHCGQRDDSSCSGIARSKWLAAGVRGQFVLLRVRRGAVRSAGTVGGRLGVLRLALWPEPLLGVRLAERLWLGWGAVLARLSAVGLRLGVRARVRGVVRADVVAAAAV